MSFKFHFLVEAVSYCPLSSSDLSFQPFKGQLQRFYKLISSDRIWPSEHGFEVIFEKSLFVFEISAFKVRNKRGIHSRFHSFSENINRESFVGDVTSDQSSMISTQRSDLTWLQSKWKLPRLTAFGRNYGLLCCLWLLNDSRKTKGISSYKFQADNQRRMQAVTTNDLRASYRRQRPLQTSSYKAKKWCSTNHIILCSNED